MLNPLDDNDGLMSQNFREIYQVAQSMEFFTAYATHEPSAIHHLVRDVARRVGWVGPVGIEKKQILTRRLAEAWIARCPTGISRWGS